MITSPQNHPSRRTVLKSIGATTALAASERHGVGLAAPVEPPLGHGLLHRVAGLERLETGELAARLVHPGRVVEDGDEYQVDLVYS